MAAVFLDVEKAFNIVWHEDLLFMMAKMYISLNIMWLIESFLSDRTFTVKVEDQFSSNCSVNANIPQEFGLSAIIFVIYTNDITAHPKSSIILFMDDTMFLTKNKNPNYSRFQLQRQINLAMDWFHRRRLKIKRGQNGRNYVCCRSRIRLYQLNLSILRSRGRSASSTLVSQLVDSWSSAPTLKIQYKMQLVPVACSTRC